MIYCCHDLVEYRHLFVMVIVLGIGGTFQYGFHIHSPSVFIKDFINHTWINHYQSPIEDNTLMLIWSFIISSYCIGGFLGSIMTGYFTSKYGSKKCLLYSDVIPMVAAVLAGCSSLAWSYEMILVGKFLYGVNAGLGYCFHSKYAGEIAPKSLRGFINTSISLSLVSGRVVGQFVGLREIFGTEQLWPVIMSLSGFWALIQLITLPFFPESPSYLLMKGDQKGCEKALNLLWGKRDHQAAIDEMLKEKAAKSGTQRVTALQLLQDPSERCQIYTLIVLAISIQFCGINLMYFYAMEVFKSAGFSETKIPYLTLGMGLCELVTVFICSLVVDRFGRRVVLLTGYTVMVWGFTFLVITISFQAQAVWISYCSVFLIFLFVISFAAGPGSTAVTVVVEIFSQKTRAPALELLGLINWLELFILTMIFPYLQASIGQFCFLIFLVVIAACAVYVYIFLPETKGKSWLEITKEFNKYNCRRKGKGEVLKPQEDIIVLSSKYGTVNMAMEHEE
ncbi:hypothetical protein GDO86_001897 [Hymenochirus boettgeri]|uniref:Solute carrier family 2, facilitated glucose transporter member 5 n=1 Tax=Hymenochirus boettgeri TaxID=247094 RepID=A0A8T2KNB5_9PIPI|nr:hypothetical protein GDO86_001897 [Hymenochirus boettgeri]